MFSPYACILFITCLSLNLRITFFIAKQAVLLMKVNKLEYKLMLHCYAVVMLLAFLPYLNCVDGDNKRAFLNEFSSHVEYSLIMGMNE